MPLYKKLGFSFLTTIVFLVALELILSFVPSWMGARQEGTYDHITSGGSALVALGDSVTFGYGVEAGESWPEQLYQQLGQRGTDISVYNRAVSGMDSNEMLQRERHTLNKISSEGKRPIALVMIGHNDLVSVGYRNWSVPESTDTAQPLIQPPRLVRVFRWMLKHFEPTLKTGEVNQQAQMLLEKNLTSLNSLMQKLNGGMYILTYLIPGEANEDMAPEQKRLLEQGRLYQKQTNTVLRSISSKEGIPLIDLEFQVDVPPNWDASWFMDHVHPYSKGHTQIAQSVRKHLCSYGELPLNLAQ